MLKNTLYWYQQSPMKFVIG